MIAEDLRAVRPAKHARQIDHAKTGECAEG
jgi:hypothetical protein